MKDIVEFATFLVFVVVVALVSGMAVGGCKWASDRFDGFGIVVRVVPDDRYKLYMCADVVNGEYKNCVSSQQVVDFARDYWVKHPKTAERAKE